MGSIRLPDTISVPAHLSYSSLSTYAECGERYRLGRGYGLDKSTWFASVAGSAIHEITEAIDLNLDFEVGVEERTFASLFDELLAKEAERGTEVKASGRVLKSIGKGGGPNKKDRDWWLIYGPTYVEAWRQWRADNPSWKVAVMPSGEPGIEVKVSASMGDVPFVGYIDRLFWVDDSELVAIDLKTGALPPSKLQLGTYKVALENQWGISPRFGAYWIASEGDVNKLWDLEHYTADYVANAFSMARRGINAGVFLPNVTGMCVGCGVREYCRAVGGAQANKVPTVTKVELRDALNGRK